KRGARYCCTWLPARRQDTASYTAFFEDLKRRAAGSVARRHRRGAGADSGRRDLLPARPAPATSRPPDAEPARQGAGDDLARRRDPRRGLRRGGLAPPGKGPAQRLRPGRPTPLLAEQPLQEIRGSNRLAMTQRKPEMGRTRLEVAQEAADRRGQVAFIGRGR